MCFGNGIVMEKIETVSDNNGVKFEPTLELNSPAAASLQYKNVLKLKRFLPFMYIHIYMWPKVLYHKYKKVL